MNTETERNRRFSGVDLLIFAVLLAVALFCAYRLWSAAKKEYPRRELLYTLRVTLPVTVEGQDGAANYFAPGQTVRDGSGTNFGEVTAVEIQPARVATVKNGNVTAVTDPGKTVFLLSVRSLADDVGAGGYRINDIRLSAGSVYNFYAGDTVLSDARILFLEVTK